ncbi:MAG: hypothetical protein O3A51_05340 [Verrucomicrobia bacterium]|nr:hypothetical protein [Verrucomicrobiota bacterium]
MLLTVVRAPRPKSEGHGAQRHGQGGTQGQNQNPVLDPQLIKRHHDGHTQDGNADRIAEALGIGDTSLRRGSDDRMAANIAEHQADQ